MNATFTRTKQVLLGTVLAGLVVTSLPAPAEAQFGGIVYDPQNHATNIQHRIENWLHWVQQLQDNITKIEYMIKQWTTMKDVLFNAEKLVAHNTTWAATMASIGNSIRGIYRLKSSLLSLVRYRVRALISIRNRLKNGLFDPAADLEDLEEYLRDGLGRSSAARIATFNRVASHNVRIQTLYERWSEKCAVRAGLEKELAELKERHEAAVRKGDAPDAISSLEFQIQQVEHKLIEINKQIEELWAELVESLKALQARLENREKKAKQVASQKVAGEKFFDIKDEFIDRLEDFARHAETSRPRWVNPPNDGLAIPLQPPGQ